MSAQPTNTLTLVSNDGVSVTATKAAVAMSDFLNDMMADLPEEALDTPVPFTEIDGQTLQNIIQWCEHRAVYEAEKAAFFAQEAENKRKTDELMKKREERAAKRRVQQEAAAHAAQSGQDPPAQTIIKDIDEQEEHVPNPDTERAHEYETRHVQWMSEWDEEFIGQLPKDDLFRLANAANFLAIEALLDYATKIVAKNMADMETEGMREYLNVKNDFDPEEEKELVEQLSWAEGRYFW
ncbi:Skp1 family, dimerization domain-containing protein [Hypoxylon trugodes]|uniref:Skp1 family, dimerization domain-containing protein n=1 Tax=Hypoxylon trugodes TaxID=326681 RepID=UPI002198D703|nr:Skp1 family, dimerization domain-containing protein [Hypoxylon trugodes]KAI1392859.1 Skp1 family, dimerization domain-containing protein [Hypoxylon trugodes]